MFPVDQSRGFPSRPRVGQLLLLNFLVLGSCAGAPPAPASGRGTLWGRISLIPHEGVTPVTRDPGVYGDHRLRDVEFVDYGRIDFAVVYLEQGPAPGGTLGVTLEPAVVGHPKLVPRLGAVGQGGRVQVRNSDTRPHPLSCPRARWIRSLGPSEEASFVAGDPGEAEIFVLDVPEMAAKFFVSPGPFARVSKDGRWEMRDLDPGERELRVWHPRFPPEHRTIRVVADAVERVDVNLTVESVRRPE